MLYAQELEDAKALSGNPEGLGKITRLLWTAAAKRGQTMRRVSQPAEESQDFADGTNPDSELTPAAKRLLHRCDDRRKEHASDALRLLERLRQANKNGELPSTAQLQREGVFGLRPVNRVGDLRKGKNLRTYYDIEKIKCPHGVYRWKLHEPPRTIEKQEWRNEGRGAQLFLSEQSVRDCFEKATGKPCPSGEVSELPLFAEARK